MGSFDVRWLRPRRTVLALLFIPLLALTACKEDAASNDPAEMDGLRVTAVFGEEKLDITEDIWWFGSKIGKVAKEDLTQSGALFGFEFDPEFSSVGVDGVYPVAEGEVGVELDFFSNSHLGRYELPEAVDGKQVLTVHVTDLVRLVIDAQGFPEEASAELTIDGPGGSSTNYLGGQNLNGPRYSSYGGNISVILKNADTGEVRRQDLTAQLGENVTVTLDFTQ